MSLPVPELMVKMGELAVSSSGHDVLVCLGLGSCIGLALVSDGGGIAGLAHVVLPESRDAEAAALTPAKFGNSAVPALLDAVVRGGAAKRRLHAVLVGGAHMFALRAGGDIGERNEAATRAALAAAGIPVRATRTSGGVGRTVRVHVATGRVVVKEGGDEHELLPGAPS